MGYSHTSKSTRLNFNIRLRRCGLQDLPRIYLVDTNIFLEVMLSQNRKEECKKFLSLLRNGRVKGIITDFTIHSIMVLMSNLKKLKELKAFLKSLTAYIRTQYLHDISNR